jgi:hypothetical protein
MLSRLFSQQKIISSKICTNSLLFQLCRTQQPSFASRSFITLSKQSLIRTPSPLKLSPQPLTPLFKLPLLQAIRHNRTSRQRHKKIIKLAKGFRGRSNRCYKLAYHRVLKAQQYQYVSRKVRSLSLTYPFSFFPLLLLFVFSFCDFSCFLLLHFLVKKA